MGGCGAADEPSCRVAKAWDRNVCDSVSESVSKSVDIARRVRSRWSRRGEAETGVGLRFGGHVGEAKAGEAAEQCFFFNTAAGCSAAGGCVGAGAGEGFDVLVEPHKLEGDGPRIGFVGKEEVEDGGGLQRRHVAAAIGHDGVGDFQDGFQERGFALGGRGPWCRGGG